MLVHGDAKGAGCFRLAAPHAESWGFAKALYDSHELPGVLRMRRTKGEIKFETLDDDVTAIGLRILDVMLCEDRYIVWRSHSGDDIYHHDRDETVHLSAPTWHRS